MDVVRRGPPDLPDSGVGSTPGRRDGVGKSGHRAPGLGMEGVAGVGEQPGGVEHPAVAVELMLIGGTVAVSHRPAAEVPGPAGELPLHAGTPAVKGQQDGKARAVQPGGVLQPGHEPAGLLVLADAQERADADAGVARPREAVVPVADAAGVLGQRRRRGGHRRTGRRVRQQPQREQAAQHHLPVRQVPVDSLAPGPPAAFVGLQRRPGRFGGDVHERLPVGDRHGDGQRPPGLDANRHGAARLNPDVGEGVHGDGGARPRGDDDLAPVLAAGLPATRTQSRVEQQRRLDGAGVGGESAHEQGRREETAGDLAHHRLGQRERPAGGLPGGLQRRRARAVAAGVDDRRAGRAEPEAAGFGSADEAAEDRLTVEAGNAEPVDGAVRGHQRGGAGVAQHRVVLYRRHVRTPRSADRGWRRRRRARSRRPAGSARRS
jgi:hypothetical protein